MADFKDRPPHHLSFGQRRRVAVATVLACLATTWWLAEEPDLAYSLPTSWALCFVVGAGVRLHRDRLGVPAWAAPVALAGLGVLSVVSLRGHTSTYLAGGPAIAALTAVLILAWDRWSSVTGPLRAIVWLGTVSYAAYLCNYPLSLWLPVLPAAALTLVAAAVSWRYLEEPILSRSARSRTAVAA